MKLHWLCDRIKVKEWEERDGKFKPYTSNLQRNELSMNNPLRQIVLTILRILIGEIRIIFLKYFILYLIINII